MQIQEFINKKNTYNVNYNYQWPVMFDLVKIINVSMC